MILLPGLSIYSFGEKLVKVNGEYCCIHRETEVVLIKTEQLKEYEKSKKLPDDAVIIKGQPAGNLWQIKWKGNYLIYAAGVGGGWFAVGFYDTSEKQNYFVRLYNSTDSKYKSRICDVEDNVDDEIIDAKKKKELVKISNDFYSELGRMFEKK